MSVGQLLVISHTGSVAVTSITEFSVLSLIEIPFLVLKH